MQFKTYLIICIIILLCFIGCFFTGLYFGSRGKTDTELYTNITHNFKQLQDENIKLGSTIEDLRAENLRLKESVGNSTEGVEVSIDLSTDVIQLSSDSRSVLRGISEDITRAENASRELAKIFNVTIKED